MAITNAQQYQQLVNKPANGKRPGYRGPGGYQGGQQVSRADPRDVGFNAAEAAANVGKASTAPTVSYSGSGDDPSESYLTEAFDVTDPRNPNNTSESYLTEAFDVTDPRHPYNTLNELYTTGVGDSTLPGTAGAILNLTQPIRNKTLRRNIDYFRELKSRGRLEDYDLTAQGYQDYINARLSGEIDAAGNVIPDTLRGDRD